MNDFTEVGSSAGALKKHAEGRATDEEALSIYKECIRLARPFFSSRRRPSNLEVQKHSLEGLERFVLSEGALSGSGRGSSASIYM